MLEIHYNFKPKSEIDKTKQNERQKNKMCIIILHAALTRILLLEIWNIYIFSFIFSLIFFKQSITFQLVVYTTADAAFNKESS